MATTSLLGLKVPWVALDGNPLRNLWAKTEGHDLSARDDAVHLYAWAVPNKRAIETIAAQPSVEIGAGTGYWAAMVRNAGGDIVAFDKHPTQSMLGNPWFGPLSRPFTQVQIGDARYVRNRDERTLVLIWPPYEDPMASDALRMYRGDRLIYVGEGNGGCTADDAFHKQLKGWKVTERIRIPQWEGIRDELTVYER